VFDSHCTFLYCYTHARDAKTKDYKCLINAVLFTAVSLVTNTVSPANMLQFEAFS